MIAVLGAGAFGTALAISLSAAQDVTLWARSGAEDINQRREVPRLPGIRLPASLQVTPDLRALDDASAILLALPMQALGGFLRANGANLPDVPHVACCKGLDLESGLGPTGIIARAKPKAQSAILTGPSFALDIAKGLPTALTLATEDDAVGAALQAMLSTPALRIYRSTDVTGAELGGALKNVIAIGAGAAIGAGLGDSARAALMTRGFAEMQRLAAGRGARPETLQGLSGFGDLVLTCTSTLSRNFRFGQALGAGKDFDAHVTVEGAATALALRQQIRAEGLDLPVCETIAALVAREVDVQVAMETLLARPLRAE